MLLSVVVALILTPVLCASLLKPVAKGHGSEETGIFSVPAFFPVVRPDVHAVLGTNTRVWSDISYRGSSLPAYFSSARSRPWDFFSKECPAPISPMRIRASCSFRRRCPAGSTLEQTAGSHEPGTKLFSPRGEGNRGNCFTLSGTSFSGTGQNVGLGFVSLKDWELRSARN